MHIPSKFIQKDKASLEKIIREYPFANLITYNNNELEANHLPFYLDQSSGKDILQGHIAKANPLWQNLATTSEVLLIFNGPDHYISPNYYPSKQVHGKAVPTWNYIAVHVKGTMHCIHDANWNKQMLDKLTQQLESDQATPWSIQDAPAAYIEKLTRAIVGLEITNATLYC